jgi:hypothetical protein
MMRRQIRLSFEIFSVGCRPLKKLKEANSKKIKKRRVSSSLYIGIVHFSQFSEAAVEHRYQWTPPPPQRGPPLLYILSADAHTKQDNDSLSSPKFLF